jgi:hypothetical protein
MNVDRNTTRIVKIPVRKQLGWFRPINFYTSGLPAGIHMEVELQPAATDGIDNLEITAILKIGDVTPGDYNIHVSGTPEPVAGGISIPITVNVPPPPPVSVVTVDFTYGAPPQGSRDVQFYSTATSSLGYITQYQWSIDGTNIDIGFNPNPVLTLPGFGTYSVTLTVQDSTGVVARKTIYVTTTAIPPTLPPTTAPPPQTTLPNGTMAPTTTAPPPPPPPPRDASISVQYDYSYQPLNNAQTYGSYRFVIGGTWDTGYYGYTQQVTMQYGDGTTEYYNLTAGSTVTTNVHTYAMGPNANYYTVQVTYTTYGGPGSHSATALAMTNAKTPILREVTLSSIVRGEANVYDAARANNAYPDSSTSYVSLGNTDYEWYALTLSGNSSKSYIRFNSMDTTGIPSNYSLIGISLVLPITNFIGMFKGGNNPDQVATDTSNKTKFLIRKTTYKGSGPNIFYPSIPAGESWVATLPFVNETRADGTPYTPGTIGTNEHAISPNDLNTNDLAGGVVFVLDTDYQQQGGTSGNYRSFRSLPISQASKLNINTQGVKLRATFG